MKPLHGFFVLLVALALTLSGCAHQSAAPTQEGGTGGVAAGPPKDKQAINMIFPDFPVPKGLTVMTEESFILSLPQFNGGIIVLKGSLPPESVQNFFMAELPKRGWQFVSSLSARSSFIAFRRNDGGQCLIKCQSLSFGRSRVEIWLAEPVGDSGDFALGS